MDQGSGNRARTGRNLKTAAEALFALRYLGTHPDGITPDSLGGALGKSTATARYLLNTLCQEGYAHRDGPAGTYRLADAPPWGESWGVLLEADLGAVVETGTVATGEDDGASDPACPGPASATGVLRREDDPTSRYELPESLADALTELYWRTRQRSYLARWDGDATVIVDSRGHQGLARVPDLRERIPLAEAHALAATKALAATSWEIEDLLLARPDRHAFTATTITSTPGLVRELARVREQGVAVDREEYAEGFCCVGAPILDPDGRVAASIAVSSPAGRFATESASIARAVREVAATAMREWRARVAVPAPTDHPATHDTGPAGPADGRPPDRR